jgi:hypothetical protein
VCLIAAKPLYPWLSARRVTRARGEKLICICRCLDIENIEAEHQWGVPNWHSSKASRRNVSMRCLFSKLSVSHKTASCGEMTHEEWMRRDPVMFRGPSLDVSGIFPCTSCRKLRNPSVRISVSLPRFEQVTYPIQGWDAVTRPNRSAWNNFFCSHWHKKFVIIENVTFIYSFKCQFYKKPYFLSFLPRNRSSAVGIATGCGQDEWRVEFLVTIRSNIFSPPRRSDWFWEIPSLLYSGYWGYSPGQTADHSPPTSTEMKKTWNYTSTPPYVFIS